ncbi:MAG: putative Na+/H+ antiporter [Pseudobdellovibrio sp.]
MEINFDIKYLATAFFFVALFHTFLVSKFAKMAHRCSEGSAAEALFHLLSEVEIVFGFWAFLFLVTWAIIEGPDKVIHYQQSLNMTEPLFIFCIMILASTRPVITLARKIILSLSRFINKLVPIQPVSVQFFILVTLGPFLGSLITEPAAITIVALLLYRMIEVDKIDQVLLYGIIGLVFVNVSVGGALTHFAAPPILVVARTWNWGLADVFINLGEASIATVLINAIIFSILFRKKIVSQLNPMQVDDYPMPIWVTGSHILFLIGFVATAHYEKVFFGLFLIFIGLTTVTKKYQDGLKFKEGLLVAFFLGGLIVFGSFQRWWLEPVILALSEKALFLSAIALTAITDNAALTYLGAQVPTISDPSKWALVSGAITGGGLTILANAPNPAGFSILSSKFPDKTLNAGKLLMASIVPTLIATLCFLLLGKF